MLSLRGTQVSVKNNLRLVLPSNRFLGTTSCVQSVADPNRKINVNISPEEFNAAKPFSQIPGPNVFTFMRRILLSGGKYHKLGLGKLHKLMHEEYGDVVKIPMVGKDDIVTIYDADQVERVFRHEGQWPYRQPLAFFEEYRMNIRPDIFKGFGGLLQDQGQSWQDTRTKVNPVLMQPKTITRYIETVDTIAEEFLSKIRSIRDENQEVPGNFGNEMNKWALESIAYVALEQRLGLFTNTDPNSDGQKMINAVHRFFDLSYQMELGLGLWKYFKNSEYNNMKDCLNTMTDAVINFINKSVEELETRENSESSGPGSVLEQLLKIDKRMAIVMALDMVMAGVDTTSNTMLIIMYQLAKNPEKQEILRKEILEKLPEKDSKFDVQTMKNFPYLRACIKESQRMEPVIVGTMRKIASNITLGGYQIPKGTYVVMPFGLMSMKENNFQRPNEFLPERFLKSQPCPELKSQQPFSFLPFGFGSRMCIGKRIADLEMEILLSRLLRNFKIEWHGPEMQYGTTFINAPVGELKFRLIEL